MSDGHLADDGSNETFVIVNEYEHLTAIFHVVEEKANSNLDYFIANKEKTRSTSFIESFQSILNVLAPLEISVGVIVECCAQFDVNPDCKGNGYRSIIGLVESCLRKIISLCEEVHRNSNKFFSSSSEVYAKLKAYTQLLIKLLTIVQFAVILLDISDNGCLYPRETPEAKEIVDGMMNDFDGLDRESFYGRTFGFQYVLSIRRVIRVVITAMAAYGDGYDNHSAYLYRAVSSVLHSRKYLFNPELRAKRITNLTQATDVNFCKAFWSLTEEYGVQLGPMLVCPTLAVNLEFKIPPDYVTVINLDGTKIPVSLPRKGNQAGLKARLLSFQKMDGQGLNILKMKEPRSPVDRKGTCSPLGNKSIRLSKYLMIHCHGGGFVAQSSKSHEIYLRYWAKELKIPILSIDYSLSPEAVFPQALEEVFFAYVWALNNFENLGTTGEKIVFTGDSAGANLMTAVALKAIMCNIRLPDSLVLAYPPYRLDNTPTPSRILCLMDALLPLGVLRACQESYIGDPTVLANKPSKMDLSSSLQFELNSGKRYRYMKYRCHSDSNLNIIKSQLASINGCLLNNRCLSDSVLSNICIHCCPHNGYTPEMAQAHNTCKKQFSENIVDTTECFKQKLGENAKPDVAMQDARVGKISSKFSICKECLCPTVNCACKTEDTGQHIYPATTLEEGRSLEGDNSSNLEITKTCNNIECNSQENSSGKDKTWEFIYKDSSSVDTISTPDVSTELISGVDTENDDEHSPVDLRNPLLSPIFASNELLEKMPHISILGCCLDPVFDDSVEFIRKLQSLGKDAELHVVDQLPHGFLNFQPFSSEARAGCNLMISVIKKSLGMLDNVI